MKDNLLPIKIKITKRLDGQNLYPPFNHLPPGLRAGGMDWSHFVQLYGIGLHYDERSGFGKVDGPDLPQDHPHRNDDPSYMYCGTCVPLPFAEAAGRAWPDLVEILTEESWQQFYEDKVQYGVPDILVDTERLQGLAAQAVLERELGITPSPAEVAKRRDALDPDAPELGVRRNPDKTWEQFKARCGISIHESKRKLW